MLKYIFLLNIFSLMKYIFSAKSALHHQAAAHGRGPVQGEGEGRRER